MIDIVEYFFFLIYIRDFFFAFYLYPKYFSIWLSQDALEQFLTLFIFGCDPLPVSPWDRCGTSSLSQVTIMQWLTVITGFSGEGSPAGSNPFHLTAPVPTHSSIIPLTQLLKGEKLYKMSECFCKGCSSFFDFLLHIQWFF